MDRETITLVTFPRSGTKYFGDLILDVFSEINVQRTHNVYGLQCKNPISIIRKPNECIASWLKYSKLDGIEESQRLIDTINWYNRFYTRVLEYKPKVFDFYDLIKNPNTIIKYIGNTFNINFNKTVSLCFDKNQNIKNYEFLSENDERLKQSFDLYYKVKNKLIALSK